MDATEIDIREVARQLIARGIMPVPVPPRSKRPVRTEWQRLRMASEQVPDCFAPGDNIGVLLGEPSGWLVDVDLDCDEAVELADQFLPSTPVVTGRSSRPRTHRWYICRGAATKKHCFPGTRDAIVELRSTGHQTLVGPSVHPDDGHVYGMLEGDPAVVDAADLAARVAALAAEVGARRSPNRHVATPPGPTTPAPRPDVADSRASEAVRRRATAYLDRMEPAVSGQGGHDRTYAAATAMVHGFCLDPDEAFNLLRDRYNQRCEPPWSEKELAHKVDDAATKPHERPRGWLRDAGLASDVSASRLGGARSRDGTEAIRACDRPCTDLGNAERLVDKFGQDVRYCPQMGRWLVWDGTRWRDDDQGRPRHLAGLVARSILDEARVCNDDGRRRELAEWAVKSESRPHIDAAVSLASAQPVILVRPDELDAAPWLLNVRNGTVDLQKGLLHPHRREDLLTKMVPVDFVPGTACPRFQAFLDRVFAGDSGLIEFVLRTLGMCLTGSITEQSLPIFHGVGANGKSVLVDTVMFAMGDYACLAPPHLLTVSGHREHATEIADLAGRRLVVASETEEGEVLRLQLIKRLTGDAVLKGRFMRQDYFSFPRTHKLIMVTNNRPRVNEDSEAAWRRLRLVPFSVVIPAAERDPCLLEKLKGEAGGILALMVAACLRWQQDGLGEPTAVKAATAEYRSAEDAVGRFIEERCEADFLAEDSSRFTPWKEIREAYVQWAEDAGEPELSDHALGASLARRNLPTVTRRLGKGPTKGRAGIELLRTSKRAGCRG